MKRWTRTEWYLGRALMNLHEARQEAAVTNQAHLEEDLWMLELEVGRLCEDLALGRLRRLKLERLPSVRGADPVPHRADPESKPVSEFDCYPE